MTLNKKNMRSLPFRRRKEARTNYRARNKIVLSGVIICTVRRSLNYVYVDFVKPQTKGDVKLAGANSKEILKKYGLVSGKNIPIAYLTGLLGGSRAKKVGIVDAVLNLSPAWYNNSSIPYATAQGCIDVGINIKMGEEAKVDISRIEGLHIANYAKMLKDKDIKEFETKFSGYSAKGLDPLLLPDKVRSVKEIIIKEEN